ncbi:MAG: NUDIX domain-containing protein [Phycisphaerales bacterium]|nr:NUDIX domain-containing protein [Phycisphaerales bacterium]
MRDHHGQLPRQAQVLRELPGVGRYTAGAIASIAFAKAVPVVDGNVSRVLARLFLIEAAIDHPDMVEHLWQLAGALVPRASKGRTPGDFNQALMELGATICTPSSPSCLLCPLGELCQARERGLENTLPRRWKRKAPKLLQHHMLALCNEGQYLMVQRPAHGLWAGLWQFPTDEIDNAEDPWTKVQALRRIKAILGSTPAQVQALATFTHQTTHRTIHFTLWHATIAKAEKPDIESPWRWCTPRGN